jgi:formimidoylglutamate deiminase
MNEAFSPSSSGGLLVPAFTTAHSHAFQRALRGKTQRPGPASRDDFWTWREAMYALVDRLTPELMGAIAREAFAELHRAGVRTVGEFHYVHHGVGGTPYDDPNELAHRVIGAALESGLRITLLRSIYERAGYERTLVSGQARFVDQSLDASLRAIEDLHHAYAHDPRVRIGIAPHSTRAVRPESWRTILAFAGTHAMPIHVHVAEQPREIEECLAETGKRPLEFLADEGALSERFVAVHGTHLLAHEATMLGAANATVCMCGTTERDLGDGLPDLGALRSASVKLCMGIDSHVVCDPFEDMRALETHERLRTRLRIASSRGGFLAEDLWRSASLVGSAACGFADAPSPMLRIDTTSSFFRFVDAGEELDALVFSGSRALDGLLLDG